LDFKYDPGNKTLTLSNYGGETISLNDLKDIYYGDSSKPNNLRGLCQPQGLNLKIKGVGNETAVAPNLTLPSVSF